MVQTINRKITFCKNFSYLKKLVTPLIYKAIGVIFSATFSNMGLIKLPESMENMLNYFVLGPCPITKTLASAAGYQDKIYLAFGRNIKDAKVERKFFKICLKAEIESQGGN